MADFFPRRDASLLDWLKNFGAVLTEGAAAWGIPAETAFAAASGGNAKGGCGAIVCRRFFPRRTHVEDV
ncbi:MAG: hypothetical protein LBT11_06690 [Treponema sp.]|nr:hypothetical protein [Treponema sp.]